MMLTGQYKNVLAIRLRQLGDVLATLDALRAIKELDPGYTISYVIDRRFHGMLEQETYIDRLLPGPPPVRGLAGLTDYSNYIGVLRRLHPCVTLDFHSNARSAILTLLSGARTRVGFDVTGRKAAYNVIAPRAVYRDGRKVHQNSAESALYLAGHVFDGIRGHASLPEIRIDAGRLSAGRELLVAAGVPRTSIDAGEVVGINPGKTYNSKAWPEENFAALAKILTGRGKQVVVVWGPGEEAPARRICEAVGEGVSFGPAVDLTGLPGVVKHLAYVVTIDSGLKHLAVCVRVPTVTIFGATSPREWHMGAGRDEYVWKDYDCSPCRMEECSFGAPCMTEITVEDVLASIDKLA